METAIPEQGRAPMARGCFCDVYEAGEHVFKVFCDYEEVLRRYRILNIDLATVRWSLAPGDAGLCAAALRRRAIRSAKECLERFPELGALADGCLESAFSARFRAWSDLGGLDHLALRRPWLLQVRAVPFRKLIEGADGDMLQVVDGVVEIVARLEELGVGCRVCNFLDNWGLADGRACVLDVGEFVLHGACRTREATVATLLSQESFQELERRRPEVSEHLKPRLLGR